MCSTHTHMEHVLRSVCVCVCMQITTAMAAEAAAAAAQSSCRRHPHSTCNCQRLIWGQLWPHTATERERENRKRNRVQKRMWQSGGTSDAIFGEHAAVAFLSLSRSRRRRLRRCLNKVDSFRKASDNNLHGLPYAKCLSLAARGLPTMGRAARHISYPLLTLATSLLRFVPTVGVVSVLCMRAVTCKNGRRRSYFGSWLHLDSLHPPCPFFR